jgi:hypothetical protein
MYQKCTQMSLILKKIGVNIAILIKPVGVIKIIIEKN